MRCKSCDYRLWNLRSRACPECGTPFKSSEFEFALNSVQFCCPHCGQDYYGTGEKGHLRPFEFNCVRCRTRINMDEMVVLPTAGIEEEQTQLNQMPWLDARRTAFRRWTGTLRMALVQPGELMRATPLDSPMSRAWGFFFITYFLTIVLASGVFCIFPLIFAFTSPRSFGPAGAGTGAALLSGFGFGLLFAAIGTLVGIALWAFVAHGFLLITGGATYRLRRTQQALLYASGANIITAIPCLGSFGWIWWLISSIIALKEAQRVNGWRASFAVLSLPLLVTSAIVAFYAWVVYAILTAGPTGPTWFPKTFGISLALTTSVKAYATANNGAGPTHPAVLLQTDPTLSPLDFVVTGETAPETVRIGNTTLDLYESLDVKQQNTAIAAAVAATATTPSVLKFGDFIFVYAGLNLNTCPGGTWIVIHEPATSTIGANTGWYDVGKADGTTMPVLASTFQSMLALENADRAVLGAPPIPTTLFAATSQPAATQPSDPADDEPDEP